MSRPVIGITAYEEEATWGRRVERAVVVPLAYVSSVVRAGGAALVLPVQSEGIEEMLERVDGLVLSGGPDVASDRYGEEPHPRLQTPSAERDSFELSLVERVSERDTPTLAICRGMQVLNVARGGSLHQHLPDVVGHEGHSPEVGEYAWHPVDVEPRSRLASLLAERVVETASHHHQAVARVGMGLEVVARADDGTIEAVEDPMREYLIGVQWHPEVGDDPALFEGLVDAARARTQARA